MTAKLTHDDFIIRARDVHGDEYEYPEQYNGMHKKINIICSVHGIFRQTPNNHVRGKQGCPDCYGSFCKTHEEFVLEANSIHNNQYEYPDQYVSAHQSINILCKRHGLFPQTPSSHIHQKIGCRQCGIERLTMAHEEFVSRSNDIHNNEYEYPDQYVNGTTPIRIICKVHGDFYQTPDRHIHGKTKCPTCQQRSFSQRCITWLSAMASKNNINIQHAMNGGEYRIPETRYRVDGYCLATKTVYEFHGDYWHGNPNVYESDYYNEITKCTMGELYQRTIKKEQKIRELGYNLVVMWESDWVNNSI